MACMGGGQSNQRLQCRSAVRATDRKSLSNHNDVVRFLKSFGRTPDPPKGNREPGIDEGIEVEDRRGDEGKIIDGRVG